MENMCHSSMTANILLLTMAAPGLPLPSALCSALAAKGGSIPHIPIIPPMSPTWFSLSLMSLLCPQVPFSGRRMHHTCPCLPGLSCLRTRHSRFRCLPDFRKEDVFF